VLIENYDLRVESPPCDPGSERWSAFAELGADISSVLPYLNAKLQGARYDHGAGVLTWRTGGRAVSFRAGQVAVSNLEDRHEAEAVVRRMVDLVNRVWEERDQIQPSLARREPPKALEVYKLLPGGNCKTCGEPTCLTFALKLAAGQAHIESCRLLYGEEHHAKLELLLQMLEAAGVGAE
jgi:ArsR family metal-binding transcriptional regulator